MEKIDVKAEDAEVPSEIRFKFKPYDDFEEREVAVGVSALVNRDSILLKLRVYGYESLKLSIAEEFAEKLSAGLTVKPIIGTILPA